MLLAFKIVLVLVDFLILTFCKESVVFLIADAFSMLKSQVGLFLFLTYYLLLYLYYVCLLLIFKFDRLTDRSPWFLVTLNCSNDLQLSGNG